MVYMAGDNSLTTDLTYALEDLKRVAERARDYLNIYAYFDGISPDVPTLYCDFTPVKKSSVEPPEPQYFQSWRIEDKLIDVRDDFNENSAAISNIINFVNWCAERDRKKNEPDNFNAFILSGHSFGFLNWGLFKDEKADYYMTHRKLRYALNRITADAPELDAKAKIDEEKYRLKTGRKWSTKYRKSRKKVIIGRKLEMLGFDSCIMSTIEIASQFRRFAKTMVASEGSIPMAGWTYASILARQIEDKSDRTKTSGSPIVTLDPQATAISFVDEFIKEQGNFALADISVDMSAWDLEKLKPLEKSFGELADAIRRALKKPDKRLRHHIRRAIAVAHAECQTFMFEQHIDLGDFCGLLAKEMRRLAKDLGIGNHAVLIRIRKACRKVIKRIRKCILLTGYTGGDFQFSTGVSAFFPLSWASYSSGRRDYEDLDFICGTYAGKRWNEMLVSFLGDVSFRCPTRLSKPDTVGRFKGGAVTYTSFRLVDRDEDLLDDCRIIGDGGGFGGWAGAKQPPNGTRQPPNGTRQPPNDPRRMDEMSVFLSRFLRLKNYRFDWNRAGFRSDTVDFLEESSTETPNSTVVIIPPARRIGKMIAATNALLKSNEFIEPKLLNVYKEILSTILYLGSEPQLEAVEMLLPSIAEIAKGEDLESRKKLHGLIGKVIAIAGDLTKTSLKLAELARTYKETNPSVMI